MRARAIAFAVAGSIACSVHAADIRGARYDARTDTLLVEIAYRGTHPHHDFRVEWGPCGDAGTVGRLIDRHGRDAAEQEHVVQERLSLEALPCRPALVTLRLGRSSLAQVHVPNQGGVR